MIRIQKAAFLLSTVFFLFTSLIAFGQEQPPKPVDLPPFGDYSLDWFKDNPYSSDSSVHAYVIANHVSTRLAGGSDSPWQFVSDHRRLVRILDRQGTEHATVRISFYSPKGAQSVENIRKLKAQTLTKTATGFEKKMVEPDRIFRTRVNENYEQISFSFAGVEDGSVVDLSYTLRSDFIRRHDRFYFQESIPVQSAFIELLSPQKFSYAASFSGFIPLYREIEQIRDRLSNRRAFNTYIAFWAIDVPLIKTEAYVSSIDNYRSNVSLELTQYAAPNGSVTSYIETWEEIASTLRNNVGFKAAMKGSKVYELWATEYTGEDDVMDKYYWAFAEVTSKVSSNGFVSTVAREKPKKALEAGEGNSAEVNILLVGLCRALGLEAAPVMISERSYGIIIPDLPGTQNLRHMICAVKKGKRYVYADATSRGSAPGVLPTSDLNGKGFLIDRDANEFVDLHSAAMGVTHLIADLTVSQEFEVSGDITLLLSGNSALQYMKIENGNYVFDVGSYEPLNDYEVEVENVENLKGQKFSITASVKRKERLSALEGVAAFPASIGGAWLKNPFAEKNRTYPVEFPYSIIQSRQVNVTLPENLSFESIPEPITVKTPNGKCLYQYTTEVLGNSLMVSQSLHVRQLIHDPLQYAGLRDMFEMLSKKEQEYISLAPN